MLERSEVLVVCVCDVVGGTNAEITGLLYFGLKGEGISCSPPLHLVNFYDRWVNGISKNVSLTFSIFG